MAIRINVELNNGIKVDGAYLRVEYPTITKDSISFHLRKYISIDKPFFDEDVISAPYDINGENPFKQAYLYLKALPEYADAEDC